MERRNTRLGLSGVVYADKWTKMDDRKRREWIIKHANHILPMLVHMDLMKDPASELTKVYDVTARYSLIDQFYNQRGEVTFELEWSRAGRAKIKQNEQEV